jgi:hypothetical protein
MRYSRATLAGVRRALIAAALFVSLPLASVAATRGPDAGGYTATDETVYSFIDISGASGGASALAQTDDGAAALVLPFAFQFYGQSYSAVCVSANGALYFVNDVAQCGSINDFANTDLTTTAPEGDRPGIFPFWSDLSFQVQGAGSVLYQVVGTAGSRRFVVQWKNAYPQGSATPITFQAILHETTNRILFQYQLVDLGEANPSSRGALATVGIRNAGGLVSGQQLPWSFNARVIGNESALLFTPPGLTAPVLTWANPAPIRYPTPLGPTQLNAAADVPGTFVYSPASGSVLGVGNNQALSVSFTPADSARYTTATATARIDVTPGNTTTTLYAFPPTAGTLQGVLLAAGVVNPDGVVPTGTVEFRDGATVLGTADIASGAAAIVANGLSAGAHSITAAYAGNSSLSASVSSPVTVTIQAPSGSTYTLVIPWANPSAAGVPVIVSALVLPVAPGGGTPTGRVEFYEGTRLLGAATAVNGLATISIPGLSAGQHFITARYLGAGSFAASVSSPTSQTVYSGTRPASSTTTVAVTPSPSTLGQPVTFTATVTPATAVTPTGTVTFYVDSLAAGTVAVANVGGAFRASMNVSTLPRGAHVITAVYGGSTAVSSSNALPAVQVVQ